MKKAFPILFLVVVWAIFFSPFFLHSKLPIPADTIIGLYHPFRDLYAKDYPNGIPYKNFLITDPVRQQIPWKNLAIDLEKKFELPLWNPYNLAGTPLLANFQSAAFYPFNILFFVLPFSTGWSILVISQTILAGIFTYLYLRNLKLGNYESLLGGLTFAFCGFLTAWLEWGTVGHTALWLPLILLSIDKIFINFKIVKSQKSSARQSQNAKIENGKLNLKNKKILFWALIFLFSLMSSFFAGHLQTFFYLFLVLLSYLLVRWLQFKKPKKTFYIFLTLGFCFLIVSALQWLPTINFIFASARNVDQIWQRPGWFIPWQNMIQFVAPDFFGNPATLNYWGEFNYAEFIGYVGIIPLILSIFALTARRNNEIFFFGTVLLLSFIFSLPTFFAKIPYLLQIPFLSTSQPTRLLFLVDFSLAILAAFGLNTFKSQTRKKRIIYPLALIAISFILSWYFVFSGFRYSTSLSIDNVSVAKRNMYLPTLLFIASTVLLLVHGFVKNKNYKNTIVVILLLITIFDLFRFFHKFTPFTDQSYLFPKSAALSYLKNQDGIFRIMTTDDRILPPNFSAFYSIQSIDGYDPLYLLRSGEFMVAMKRNKADISSPFGFNRIITPHNVDSQLVDLLGVKYILSFDEIESTEHKKVFEEGKIKIYENMHVYDRTFFVENVIYTTSKNESIKKIFDPEVDLSNTAIVEDLNDADGKSRFASGLAKIVKYKENQIIIETKNAKDGFLVLMDTFYPTWSAEICTTAESDCKETKIYLTNYNFRGIIVPPGHYKIIFKNSLL